MQGPLLVRFSRNLARTRPLRQSVQSAAVPKPAKIRKTVAMIAEAPEPEPKNTTRSKLIRGQKNQGDSNNGPTTRRKTVGSCGLVLRTNDMDLA